MSLRGYDAHRDERRESSIRRVLYRHMRGDRDSSTDPNVMRTEGLIRDGRYLTEDDIGRLRERGLRHSF